MLKRSPLLSLLSATFFRAGCAQPAVVTAAKRQKPLLQMSEADRVTEAMKSGIAVVACENTLRTLKMSRSEIIEGSSFVPAGVVQIMRRQGEGWFLLTTLSCLDQREFHKQVSGYLACQSVRVSVAIFHPLPSRVRRQFKAIV